MSRQDSSPDVKPVSSVASASRKRTLPAWLDHFNIHDLKILFRCWVAAWVAILLIFIQPALTNIGQATCDLFQQKLRKPLGGRARIRRGKRKYLSTTGTFLNAKVTAIFFVMGLIFIYVLARLRCANPKLFFFQMFGTVAMDLFILFGLGLPSYQADLAVTLVKPGAIGTALGTTCCLLFFPQSTSYAVLDSLGKLVSLMQKPIELTRRGLRDEELPMEELRTTRLNMVSLYKSIGPLVAFLPLDMSRERWNTDDVRALYGHIREAMVAGLSLLDLHITWAHAAEKKAEFEKYRQDHSQEKHEHHEAGHRQLSDTAELMTVNSCRWLRVPSQQTFTELQSELGDLIATIQHLTDSLHSSDAVDESQTSKRVDPDSDDGAVGDHAQEASGTYDCRDWLFGVPGMFALRMVVVTLVTAIVSVIPHSSGFFYREKGIWVVITAQLCILTYMSDFAFSLLTRVVGTIAGGVLGMLVWYIGSGDGTDNPYGLAATTAVALPIVLWLRIFLLPVYVKATILFGVTFCLVIGFSYDMTTCDSMAFLELGTRPFGSDWQAC
ncbi:uncharacterized protein J7T54_003677 [Emericellopsis cladophorae]|uniref:ER transporter 6TM N-terminal domain-containing protein n=1 Tax=Emericellopsis cladophorae TaxID=2686198 RepID=A0A9P9Y360_9HYPO|nr:uncharacterized protein J7T54_003677 [Emericellopsis cladophorae]KAI6782664.1 hypothetical protein J7T54_003677 [Emericellopsis cladophorae]